MPIGLLCPRATMPRGLIARLQKSRGASRRKRFRAPNWSPFGSDAAAHLLSSDLTAYLVEEVVQFFPWYLGLHPAGIPHVELPRRLFISTLRGRNRIRRTIAEEDEENPVSLRSFKCHEPSPVSLSCFCGCSRKLFLRHINSRWRAAKCERRSRDNGHDDARPVLHSSSSGMPSLHQPVTSVHHSSPLLSLHSTGTCVRSSSYEIALTHDTSHLFSLVFHWSFHRRSVFYQNNYSYVDYKIIQLHIAFNILISLLLTHYYCQFINLFMNLIEEYCIIFTQHSTNWERICSVKNIYKINNYNN